MGAFANVAREEGSDEGVKKSVAWSIGHQCQILSVCMDKCGERKGDHCERRGRTVERGPSSVSGHVSLGVFLVDAGRGSGVMGLVCSFRLYL
jgi:hypothetical protein